MSDSKRAIVTRFAPSPTGELHIGGARTALFNWALARHYGGRFLLRIEDTDRARSSEASTRRILADLKWLGFDWDEGPDLSGQSLDEWLSSDTPIIQKGDHGPYFQSQRKQRGIYDKHVKRLLETGRAYKCFKTHEELADMRAHARAAGKTIVYDPTESRTLSPDQIARFESQGLPFVIRFAMPHHDITVHDEVLGNVTVKAEQLEDFVIIKADGFPTYHFAVVVDDWAMGVTHVLRGQEHLNNTPKHIALQEALEFNPPTYAHIPLIFNPDGSKMSKRDKAKAARAAARKWIKENNSDAEGLYRFMVQHRHGCELSKRGVTRESLMLFLDKKSDDAEVTFVISIILAVPLPPVEVDDFRVDGYLPEVLINYLTLLGWNPGGDLERFDAKFLCDHFSLERIGKSNAKFDIDKLRAFNQETIASLPVDEFRKRLWCFAPVGRKLHADLFASIDDPRFITFARAYQLRSKTLADPYILGHFFFKSHDKIQYNMDDKNIRKTLRKNNDQGLRMLEVLLPRLEAIEPWSGEGAHQAIQQLADEHDVKPGVVAQPLRVAVSGGTVTPPIDATLDILGKQETLKRINHCLTRIQVSKTNA